MKKIVLMLFFYVSFVYSAAAVSSGTSSFDFMRLDVGARMSALAGAGTSSTVPDSFSFYYNPALSAYVPHIDISLAHMEYLENLRNENINAVFKVNNSYRIGIGIMYMYANDFIHTVSAENIEGFSIIGKFSYYDLMAVVNNSFILSKYLIGGINIKYVSEKIYLETADGVLFDIGVKNREKLFGIIEMGVSVENMGESVKFVDKKEKVPLIVRGGLSSGFSLFNINTMHNDIALFADIVKEIEYNLSVNFGLEFWAFDIISIRGGYKLNIDSSRLSDITVGLGINYDKFELGYAFIPFDYFGNTHRISLNIRL